jgi:hypothetical protein
MSQQIHIKTPSIAEMMRAGIEKEEKDRYAPAPPKFDFTPQELRLVEAIAHRLKDYGQTVPALQGKPFDFRAFIMDIMTVHCNDCPIELYQLLMSDQSDFLHDVCGIVLHIDRPSGGKLRNDFKPIFAVKKT